MVGMGAWDTLLDAVRLLAGSAEVLEDLTFSSRTRVVRLRTEDGTVLVAKQHKDPAAVACEELALRTLPRGVGPELIGVGHGVLVMEDLGSGPSVADLLLGTDSEAARAGLVNWATALGHVAAATAATEQAPGSGAARWLRPDTEGIVEAMKPLGVAAPAGWAEELAGLYWRLEADVQRCFVLSDACPDNNRVTDQGVRLFDFEASGWGHAAQDASYLLAPFCTCWCVTRLPPDIQAEMIEAYRRSYAPAETLGFMELALARRGAARPGNDAGRRQRAPPGGSPPSPEGAADDSPVPVPSACLAGRAARSGAGHGRLR